jgi:hypothetical protein
MVRRIARLAGILLIPLAVLSIDVSFRFPEGTERLYSQGLYPQVVRLFAALNRASFSVAEVLVLASVMMVGLLVYRGIRATPRGRRAGAVLRASWAGGGVLLWTFLLLWGFNYARPSLEERIGLTAASSAADPGVLLDAGARTAAETARLFATFGKEGGPTSLPMAFHELDARIDEGYRSMRLPGDSIRSVTTPAKPLASSGLISYLDISGIFVPFTGEPSVNALQPDVSLPLVLAHEKAHQRGITHEGEANFAAFLVCSREEAPPYLRYAAYLFATSYLLGEASLRLPREDVDAVWQVLGPGPLADLRALHEFWRSYQGRASAVANQVNDRYLRALRVPEGVESYETVVRMLLALDGQGKLVGGNEGLTR